MIDALTPTISQRERENLFTLQRDGVMLKEEWMSVEVRIPTVLQKAVGGAKVIRAEGRTVGELLANIGELHPGFRHSITTESGELHRFVNVYLNDEDIRFLGQLETPVSDGDVVSILPALAGGR